MSPLKNLRMSFILVLIWTSLATVTGCCLPPGFSSPTSPLSTSPVEIPPAADFPIAPGGQVVFHREEESKIFNIYLLNLDNGDMTQLITGNGNHFDPTWSPDGTQIAFISDRNQHPPYGTVWVMNADGSNPHPLLEAEGYIELGPTWSPDGTRIAFQSNRAGGANPDIFILDIDSGKLTNLTNHPNIDANPAWSPDGTKIAFTSDRSGNPEIWMANVDGTGLQKITEKTITGEWRPAWSPNGRNLAFESFPTIAPRHLLIQNLDNADTHTLETFSVWNMWPTWITDDLMLYAASEKYNDDTHRGSPANLYLQNVITGATHQLTSGPGDDGHPSWRP
jgi:Tol biopolymer transport system component